MHFLRTSEENTRTQFVLKCWKTSGGGGGGLAPSFLITSLSHMDQVAGQEFFGFLCQISSKCKWDVLLPGASSPACCPEQGSRQEEEEESVSIEKTHKQTKSTCPKLTHQPHTRPHLLWLCPLACLPPPQLFHLFVPRKKTSPLESVWFPDPLQRPRRWHQHRNTQNAQTSVSGPDAELHEPKTFYFFFCSKHAKFARHRQPLVVSQGERERERGRERVSVRGTSRV